MRIVGSAVRNLLKMRSDKHILALGGNVAVTVTHTHTYQCLSFEDVSVLS